MEDSSEETSLPRSRSDSPVSTETMITAFISQTGTLYSNQVSPVLYGLKKTKVLNYIYMYEDILVKFLKVIDKVWFFLLFFSSLEGILCIWISKFCLISLESQEWWRNLTRILGRLTLCLLCERRRSVEMRKRFQTPIVAIATSMTYICWSKKR